MNGHWRNTSARPWGALLWLGWALPFLSLYSRFPDGAPVVANVLLLAGAALLLFWQAAPRASVPVDRRQPPVTA